MTLTTASDKASSDSNPLSTAVESDSPQSSLANEPTNSQHPHAHFASGIGSTAADTTDGEKASGRPAERSSLHSRPPLINIESTSSSSRGRMPDAKEIHASQTARSDEEKRQVSSSTDEGATPQQSSQREKSQLDKLREKYWKMPMWLAWIRPTFTQWSTAKPVLRSALVLWLMMLLLVIYPVELTIGSASFLVLVFAALQPAELPLSGIIEREFFLLIIGLASWAWTCLGIEIAHAARTNKLTVAETDADLIFTGYYIEAGPSVVCAFMIAIGSGALLYLKVRFGPSPFTIASIMGCIFIDIVGTYTALYPYRFFTLGTSVLIPMAIKSAATLIVAVLFLPKSVNSLFVDRVVTALNPLSAALKSQITQFQSSPLDPTFEFGKTRATIGQSERAIPLVLMASRLLSREISFGLASGQDLREIETLTLSLLAPANGFSQYFTWIQSDRQSSHFPQSKTGPNTQPPSQAGTPRPSRPVTPAASTANLHESQDRQPRSSSRSRSQPTSANATASLHTQSRLSQLLHRGHLHAKLLHHHQESPTPSHRGRHRDEDQPVGVWEHLRFAQMEARLHSRSSDWVTEEVFQSLGQSSANILRANADAVDHVIAWLQSINKYRYAHFFARFTGRKVTPGSGPKGSERRPTIEVIEELQAALTHFKDVERLTLIEPFKDSVSDPTCSRGFSHRYLFQAWIHQYTSILFAERLLGLLGKLEQIERERTRAQFWFPSWPRLLKWDTWRNESNNVGGDSSVAEDEVGEENQDQSDDEWYRSHLGMGGARPRNPDALEPTSRFHKACVQLHFLLRRLVSGNLLFALKAGSMSGLVSIIFLVRSSADFAVSERAIWTLIVSQLTLLRHRGDVISSLISRVQATFWAVLIGIAIWYMDNGADKASPYGMMVLWAAVSIPLMGFRLYFASPVTAILSTVTVVLVVGYSWKDQTDPGVGSPGSGWPVAWKRFLEVVIGTSVAVVWSFVPPTSTLRGYLRSTHASLIARSGILHCKLLALASTQENAMLDPLSISRELITHRQKLRRLDFIKANAVFETSLMGKWPVKRYTHLFEIQLELSKLLSAAISVCSRLDPVYSRALLKRTRFSNEDFTADVMSVYALCSSALRTAQPLPQIAPILFSRFLTTAGFKFYSEDDEVDEDFYADGLPKELTPDVLESERYMTFAVGVITLSSIVMKLDALLLAVKELVGESYSLPPDLYWRHQHHQHSSRDPTHYPAASHASFHHAIHTPASPATPDGTYPSAPSRDLEKSAAPAA